MLHDDQSAWAEKGDRLKLSVDIGKSGLVPGMRGQPKCVVSLAEDDPPQCRNDLTLEEILIAMQDVDRLRLQALGTFEKDQAVHQASPGR